MGKMRIKKLKVKNKEYLAFLLWVILVLLLYIRVLAKRGGIWPL